MVSLNKFERAKTQFNLDYFKYIRDTLKKSVLNFCTGVKEF